MAGGGIGEEPGIALSTDTPDRNAGFLVTITAPVSALPVSGSVTLYLRGFSRQGGISQADEGAFSWSTVLDGNYDAFPAGLSFSRQSPTQRCWVKSSAAGEMCFDLANSANDYQSGEVLASPDLNVQPDSSGSG